MSGEAPSQFRIFPADIFETVAASDNLSSGVVKTLARITEDANATDVPTPIATMSRRGNLFETVTASEQLNATVVLNTAFKETVTVTDKASASRSFNVQLFDFLYTDDAPRPMPVAPVPPESFYYLGATYDFSDEIIEHAYDTEGEFEPTTIDYSGHIYEHSYYAEGEFAPSTVDYFGEIIEEAYNTEGSFETDDRVWRGFILDRLPGGNNNGLAKAISVDGHWAGGYSDLSSGRAVLYNLDNYTVTEIPNPYSPPVDLFQVTDLSADGSVLILYGIRAGIEYAGYYVDGVYTELAKLAADPQIFAAGISADGTMIVGYTGFPRVPVYWLTDGTGPIELPHNYVDQSADAVAVSDDKLVICGTDAEIAVQWIFDGVDWIEVELPADLGSAAAYDQTGDASVVVGTDNGFVNAMAVYWEIAEGIEEQLPLFSGAPVDEDSLALGVSNDGVRICGFYDDDDTSRAVVWTNSVPELLPGPNDVPFNFANLDFSEAFDISGSGLVIIGDMILHRDTADDQYERVVWKLVHVYDVDIFEPVNADDGATDDFCVGVIPEYALAGHTLWKHVLGVELKSTKSTRR